MKIREYNFDDYEVCKRIIKHSTAQINEKYSDEELEHLEEVIPEMVADFTEKEGFNFYVAEKNDEVVGVAGYHSKGKISGVFIHPDYQREGIGKKLMKELGRKPSKEGIQSLEVSSSLTAEKFYKKFGFQKLRKKDSDIEGKDIPVYKMEKKL